ncbi:MAG TPA: helix-turn-helix domain-containing protein [Labilithrix sp.]|nr:helix-turn-helix domain-containing protein [Labilithrix sp.]
MLSSRPALHMIQRFATPATGLVIEIASLRRPEFALRVTRYEDIVVDERLLTRSFPFVPASSRVVCALMLEGALEIDGDEGRLDVVAGESVLLGIPFMRRTRWVRATYLDLEWTPQATHEVTKPTRLGPVDLEAARAVAAALVGRYPDQRPTLESAFELVRALGAPFQLSTADLLGEPTEGDRRLAHAMEVELANLASRATGLHLSESMKLSPRQLQRVVQEFNARYQHNAGNWRDNRNRWRLQLAALLLSRPALTVAEVAHTVGYASSNALARAFLEAGFPPPAAVRAMVLSGSARAVGE